MEDIKLGDELRELIETGGDTVGMNSKDCVIWKLEHKNCKNCPTELGCGKVVRLMSLMLLPSMYQPQSYDDFAQMQNRISELQKKILDAKTVDTLLSIPQG